jgi:23S rRNA (uracil1939-C5)-methyltransferase
VDASAGVPAPWNVVILDPPRSGLHPRALERVRQLRAPRIVYVSCNPATLARDAGVLVNEDGYHPIRLRAFDLFPQTPHIESVLLLTREKEPPASGAGSQER